MKKIFTKTALILLIIAVVSFIGHLFIYSKLPAQIPIQWGSDGSVNSYGEKYMDLVLAGIPIGIIILMSVSPHMDPRKASYLKHAGAYNILMIGVSLLLVACSWLSALAALGYNVNIQTLVPVAVGILFIVIGNRMPQIRSNYFFGIKTPWTLENPDVWRKTHKFGGILFCMIGIVFIVVAFLPYKALTSIIIAPFIIGSVVLMYLYSYIIYKKIKA
ncbi:MAG: SdpI family protein [Lachnospiraceae bacterium]|nr:SdpI family protein [Lachnospiraceae bacterium]